MVCKRSVKGFLCSGAGPVINDRVHARSVSERALAIGTDALVFLALDFLADPAAWLAP